MSLLAVAEEAAIAAGELLRERFEAGVERALRTKSTPTDLVSAADLAAEAAIREVLTARRPDDAVLGEEGGRQGAEDALLWVVDPLDGTLNFLHGLPAWCVSVAVRDADGPLAGVILDPLRGELFAASRDGEARLGEAVLGGSACTELAQAIVGTGFAYEAQVRGRPGRGGRAAAAEDREPAPHRRVRAGPRVDRGRAPGRVLRARGPGVGRRGRGAHLRAGRARGGAHAGRRRDAGGDPGRAAGVRGRPRASSARG